MSARGVLDRWHEAGRCFLVAEAGINHNGDVAIAHKMIDAAADSGADAVKFQHYRTEEFVSDRSLTYTYVSQGREVTESQWDMFKRCELDLSSLIGLKRHCEERGVIFFSTPISEAGLADLLRVAVPMLKNGSDCLGHLPLLRAMARSGLPTIISTGMATEPEIRDAVQAFREAGGSDLILLHCTSAYPTPPQDVNLRKIAALREKFRCPVGLSDHTEGTVAALGAVALGACMVEKHFTIDKNMAGPDHRFSADHAEFRELVQSVRLLERQLGSAELGPAESERDGRLQYKLSCMAARDLPCGHRVAAEDIVFRRPGTGLPPRDAQRLVGKELKRGVSSGDFLRVEDCR